MIAGFVAITVVAALLFIRWVVSTLRDADRRAVKFEADWRVESAQRKAGDDAYAKLDKLHDDLRRRYVALARKSVSGLNDEELVDMLGGPLPVGNGLLDPFAADHRGADPHEPTTVSSR